MKYAVMVYETGQDFAQRNNEEAPAYWAAYSAYGAALREAGVAAGGQALQGPSDLPPSSAHSIIQQLTHPH